MNLIETRDLYEDEVCVIIKAQFDDNGRLVQQLDVGIKNLYGDITEIRTISKTSL